MNRRVFNSIQLVFLLLGTYALTSAYAQSLPSTTEFQNMLSICAAGNSFNLSADLRGSLTSIYEKDKTQGTASINNMTQFLGSLPEKDRLEGYKIYSACIKDFLRKGSDYQSYQTAPEPMRQKNTISPHASAALCRPPPIDMGAIMHQNGAYDLRSLPAPNLPSVIQPKTVEILLGKDQMIWPGVTVSIGRFPALSEQPMIMVIGTGRMKAVSGFCEVGQQLLFSPTPSRTVVGEIDEVTSYGVTMTFREVR